MKKRFPRIYRHIAARFAPDTQFGLHLTAGVALLGLAVWLFGAIASEVVAGSHITLIDQQVADWFHGHAASGWTPFMLFVTHWHAPAGVLAMSFMLAIYFHVRRARYWLASLALAVPGGLLLNVLLKYIFQRARPSFGNPLLTLDSFSFPSGHTSGAVLFYGVFAAYLVCATRPWPLRAVQVGAALGMVALVALSRVYLGVHYLSDVLAAMAVSGAWLATCITAMSTLRRRRAVRVTE
ncbi:MAG: phosphatase PAP2 family protein [Pseudomonadota bacterium]